MKNFSGVKTKYMEDYAQPTIIANPDPTVIYVGVNNLPIKKESTEKSSQIMNLGLKFKLDTCQISNFKFNNKKLSIS